MRPLREAPRAALAAVRCVLTDMDDTLTHRGRLSARTYAALERLETAGVPVIPVTAAPAGWADQMVRMWPVAGVIAENGGVLLRRAARGDAERWFWHDAAERAAVADRLSALAADIAAALPAVVPSADQPFRLTSLAYDVPADPTLRAALIARCRAAGADVTVNSLWVLGWFGGYDKLSAARRALADLQTPTIRGLDIDAARQSIAYAGDSLNDAPMFAFFPVSVGVSTVVEWLPDLPTPPAWITEGPGGDGFVELADALLSARA